MSTAVAPVESPAAVDPRMAAFLAPDCPEVFHSVATPTAIWKADPYDVETIHAEARAAFEHLLNRAGRTPPPPSGAVLVLLGEAGSGKTHLMRAFRTRAHGQGLGYCGYLQMTAEASNYARYMLTNLIDGLEQPYDPDGPSRTGLARLSAALLESVPGLSGTEMEAFRDGDVDATPLGSPTNTPTGCKRLARFRDCDLELLRVMLHLERNEPQVRSRALMWLRCQDMRPQDREWIGDAVPRTDDADPMKMLQQLAKLTDAVHGVPLVLLIDQLEDMANQSAPVERFLKVIDAITAFTDTIPNTVVVLACLEDYFKANVEKLTKSKQDRLVRDPEPIRLLGNRTLDEIREMTARRLALPVRHGGGRGRPGGRVVSVPRRPPRPAEQPAVPRRPRFPTAAPSALHHRGPVGGAGGPPTPTPPPPPENDLDPLWNDFHTAFQADVPDGEEELANVLADAIGAADGRAARRLSLRLRHAGRQIPGSRDPQAGQQRRQTARRRVQRDTRGAAFGKQISELEKRAGEIPVAIVRTTDFPKTGKAATQIAGMLKRHGRKVVVADADWRRMLAFEAFRKQHATRPDFAAWQKTARPLGELDSLQKILKLSSLAAIPRAVVAPPPPVAPPPASDSSPTCPDGSAPASAASAAALVLGHTAQRNAGPGHLRAERVRPTCGVPGRDGQRQDDGRAEPDRTIARPRRARRSARPQRRPVPVRRPGRLGPSA